MANVLEARGATKAERLDIPYISARGRNVAQACAQMMVGAMPLGVMPPGVARMHDAPEFWASFTGVRHKGRQATTGLRALQSFGDNGVSLTVIGDADYKRFAETGDVSVLPKPMVHGFKRLNENQRINEQYSAGYMIGKLALIDAYEQRPAQLEDVNDLLESGWVVKLAVNGLALAGRRDDGFRQHGLIVTGMADDGIIAHDPGGYSLPGGPNREFDAATLDAAWEDTGYMLHAIGAVRPNGAN